MFSATWVTSSSSKQYLTSLLIASRTFASGPLPSATPRIAISRSVIIPTSLSFSVTGKRPASIFFISAAALRMVSSGLISCTSRLITVVIFIVVLLYRVSHSRNAPPNRSVHEKCQKLKSRIKISDQSCTLAAVQRQPQKENRPAYAKVEHCHLLSVIRRPLFWMRLVDTTVASHP